MRTINIYEVEEVWDALQAAHLNPFPEPQQPNMEVDGGIELSTKISIQVGTEVNGGLLSTAHEMDDGSFDINPFTKLEDLIAYLMKLLMVEEEDANKCPHCGKVMEAHEGSSEMLEDGRGFIQCAYCSGTYWYQSEEWYTHRPDRFMRQDSAEKIADLFGGYAWNSGGNVMLVTFKNHKGHIVCIGQELICEYKDQEAFDNGEALNTIEIY